MLHLRGNRERERGQIVVLFALVLVVILAFTSLVIDIGLLRNNRQTLVNSLDSAALAGGTLLPVDGSIPGDAAKIDGLITSTIQANYPGLPSSAYTISYKCLIGVDTSTPAKPYISRDVPLVCDPHFSLGHNPPVASDFAGSGPTRFSSCDPAVGDRCNAVLIAGAANTPFSFGRVVGVNQGSTGLVVSAACNGPCGTAPSSPVDVVLVIDRTSSMNGTDTTNAKAAANSLVGVYDPAQQWLALGTLGPSTTSGGCVAGAAGSIGTATAPADLRRWVPVGLSGVGSSVSSTYANISAAITCYPNSSTGTDLADPMTMAAWELTHNGRTGVRKGIIFETDGQPNAAVGAGPNYCAWRAPRRPRPRPRTSRSSRSASASTRRAAAIPPARTRRAPGRARPRRPCSTTWPPSPRSARPTCDDTENNDDDHFFCIGKTGASTDLSKIFKAAATQLAKGKSHLVNLYPIPVVTAVSPSSGSHNGGTTVTVSGSFFTGRDDGHLQRHVASRSLSSTTRRSR